MASARIDRPAATVIIPVWNAWVQTRRCLEALPATLGPRDRVVVVDNGSTDGTAAGLARFPWITTVALETNLGLGTAVNRGVGCARGSEVIAVLHNDTRPIRGWLDALIARLADPVMAAAGSVSNCAPGAQSVTAPDHFDQRWARRWVEAHRQQSTVATSLSSFALALRRSVFEDVGGFSTDYPLAGWEDRDLSDRLCEAGWALTVALDSFVFHEGGATLAANGLDPGEVRAAGAAIYRQRVTDRYQRRPLLSACLIVRDEQERLPACLDSLRGVVDEVVVADTGSVDGTVAAARAAGATVVQVAWDDDFAAARNEALGHCHGEWVLSIDADETLYPPTNGFRHALAAGPNVDLLTIAIENLTTEETEAVHLHSAPRLFRRDRCLWRGRLHEQLVPRPGQPPLRGARSALARLHHHGYTATAIGGRDKLARNVRIAERSVESDPGAASELTLARSLAAAGRGGDALGHYRRARELAGEIGDRVMTLRAGVECLLSLRRTEEAGEWLGELRTVGTASGATDLLEARALGQLGQHDRAFSLLEGITDLADEFGITPPPGVLDAERSKNLAALDGMVSHRDPPRVRDQPQVAWIGLAYDPSGLGAEARGFLGVLGPRLPGLRLYPIRRDVPDDVGDESGAFLGGLEHRPEGAGPISVVHLAGRVGFSRVDRASYCIARAMFETDGLPAPWVERANQLDEIWVPSHFNMDTFERAGVRTRLTVIPGGVDAERFRPGLTPLELPDRRDTVFLGVFEWSLRKGWDVLLRAWVAAFGAGDPVTLVLRCSVLNDPWSDGSAALSQRIDDYLRHELGVSPEEVAPINVLGGRLDAGGLPRLLAAADVLVAPSRGEGWGRPQLEAMACGLAVIATGWSGNLEFMDDANSLLIEAEAPVDCGPGGEEIDVFAGQRWAEPSVEHLAQLLRVSAGDPRLRHELGARARADVERRWTWDHVGARAEDRLRQIWRDLDHGGRAGAGPSSRSVTMTTAGPAVPAAAAAGSAVPRAAAPLLTLSKPGPSVRWSGRFFDNRSLAIVNREIVTRLAGDGWDLRLATVEPLPSAPALATIGALASPGLLDTAPVDIEVRHEWPPRFDPPSARRLVMIQPWEYGSIPRAWVGPIEEMVDELWVPSSWVRDCYIGVGIEASRIVIVPNGVDSAVFTPIGGHYPLRTRKSFRFLFVGGLIWRKGVDLLLRAYQATFSGADDVCLVVKSSGTGEFYNDPLADLVSGHARLSGGPEMEIIDGDLTTAEMAGLYRSCHALVLPYRGEGFGMPVAEALSVGLPVITTGYGGSGDICAGAPGATLLPSALHLLGEGTDLPEPATAYFYAEPDISALCSAMAKLLDGGPRSPGPAVAPGVLSWDQVAALVEHRLRSLAAR